MACKYSISGCIIYSANVLDVKLLSKEYQTKVCLEGTLDRHCPIYCDLETKAGGLEEKAKEDERLLGQIELN